MCVVNGLIKSVAIARPEHVARERMMSREFREFVTDAARGSQLFTRQAEPLRGANVFPHMIGEDVRERLRVVNAARNPQRLPQELGLPWPLVREG